MALYFLYQSWILQPDMKIIKIQTEKTFLRRTEHICLVCGAVIEKIEKNCHRCGTLLVPKTIGVTFKAIPTVYVSGIVKNEGRVTAKDCFVRFSSDGREWYGRWGVPDHPERFNLHPNDTRKVHIFRTYLSITAKKLIKDEITNLEIHSHRDFPLIQNLGSDYKKENMEIISVHPRKEIEEEKGISKYGGWIGSKFPINIDEELKINYLISAENWSGKGKLDSLFEHSNLRETITDGNIWQNLDDKDLIKKTEKEIEKLKI